MVTNDVSTGQQVRPGQLPRHESGHGARGLEDGDGRGAETDHPPQHYYEADGNEASGRRLGRMGDR
eukprot:4546835-Pyramimonas_sp.AAC.1